MTNYSDVSHYATPMYWLHREKKYLYPNNIVSDILICLVSSTYWPNKNEMSENI